MLNEAAGGISPLGTDPLRNKGTHYGQNTHPTLSVLEGRSHRKVALFI